MKGIATLKSTFPFTIEADRQSSSTLSVCFIYHTAPIAIEIAEIVGGIPSLTVSLVVITGLLGCVCGPELLKLMRIKDDVAKGIALGSISHAMGTARAFKESEVQGSMGGLAIAVAGVMTALLMPVIILFL